MTYTKRVDLSGAVASRIVSKHDMPHRRDGEVALRAVDAGAAHIEGTMAGADVQLVAVGTYQLEEALKAARRLAESAARLLDWPRDLIRSADECATIDGRGDPNDLIKPCANRRTA